MSTDSASSAASASCSSMRFSAGRPRRITRAETTTDVAANQNGTEALNACQSAAAIGGAAAPPRKRTAVDERYGSNLSLKTLKEEVEKVKYPALDVVLR